MNPGDLVIVTKTNELCIVVEVRRDVLGGSSVWSLDGSAQVTHTPRRDQLLLQGGSWTSWCDEKNVTSLDEWVSSNCSDKSRRAGSAAVKK